MTCHHGGAHDMKGGRVQPDHPRVVELRELSRVEDNLGQELRRLSNRLREQLHRFFPQALTLCPAADEPWVWTLLERVATPAHAQRLPARTVAAVLKVHRIRRFTVDPIREALQTPAVHVAPGTWGRRVPTSAVCCHGCGCGTSNAPQ
jgi:hypothetical protein